MTLSSVDRARRAREKSIARDAVDADSPGEVVMSQPETMRYEAFHARVDAVFAAVGRGTMGAGGAAASARASDGEGAWRPRASAVVRRGRGVVEEDDDEEDDDEDGTARRAYRDDLDCLESDEDGDDDARRMARLRGSVGRCRALEREDDFDDADAAAMGDDARADVRGAIGARDESRPRAVPHHLAHPEKYTRYDLGDDAPYVGVAATFADEPARNARDERPNTPNAHAETSPRDTTATATTRPQFSREAAAKVRPPKRRRTDASQTDDARRVRVAFEDDDVDDNERDANETDEKGKKNPTRALDDDDDDDGRSSRRPRRLRKK